MMRNYSHGLSPSVDQPALQQIAFGKDIFFGTEDFIARPGYNPWCEDFR